MGEVILEQVGSRRTEREFLRFGREIYRLYPHYVTPLDDDIEGVFDPLRNKLFDGGEAVRWIARDPSGRTVGRIAAFYNRAQAAIEEQPTGGVGFFESVDSQEVADTLFDAAHEWLAERGMEAMDGPVNFGSRDMWWGLLVDGFDIDPLYGNPYNPPYYRTLFENYGFREYFNQHTYERDLDPEHINPSVIERVERLKAEGAYTFEHIDTKQMKAVPEDFRKVYNRAWSSFTGVKQLSKEEVEELFKTLRPIIDPRLIYFARKDGEPVGFFVMIPDLNRVIKPFRGHFGTVNKLRLLWKLKTGRCNRIFAMIFGVDPDYQRRGIEAGMIMAFGQTVRRERLPYRNMELAWVGDFNPVMMRVVEQYVEARRIKRHITYRYLFDRNKEFRRCPSLKLTRRPSETEVI